MCSTRSSESDPIRSPKRILSIEEICETTTTLRLGRPLARLKQHVSRLARPVQVRRHRAHDHVRDARVVEDVVLDHRVGMGVARVGRSGVVRPHPEHVAAVDPSRQTSRARWSPRVFEIGPRSILRGAPARLSEA